MNILADAYQIDRAHDYIETLISKYHVDSLNNPEMRGFTGEEYRNHLMRVSERNSSCFQSEISQKKAKVIGLGHDLLEKLIDNLFPMRGEVIKELESFGQEGPIISQSMQLLDFKIKMPEFVLSKGGTLIPETLSLSTNKKKEIKNENYSLLIDGLLGDRFGSDYFEEGVHQKSLLYAIVTKMADQHDNLDVGRIFNKEYNEKLFLEGKDNGTIRGTPLDKFLRQRESKFNYQTTRNGIRIYRSHNSFHETVLDNKFVDELHISSFRSMYKENLAHAKEIVEERGTNSERKVFSRLLPKYK
jgi:hypothetical protein